jgi:hypothetical protein
MVKGRVACLKRFTPGFNGSGGLPDAYPISKNNSLFLLVFIL